MWTDFRLKGIITGRSIGNRNDNRNDFGQAPLQLLKQYQEQEEVKQHVSVATNLEGFLGLLLRLLYSISCLSIRYWSMQVISECR